MKESVLFYNYFSSSSEGGTAPSVLNTHLSHKEMTVEKMFPCFLFLVTWSYSEIPQKVYLHSPMLDFLRV